MGVRFSSAASKALVTASLASPGEFVLATCGPIILPFDFAAVCLFWSVKWTSGSTAPTVSYNLRRGATITDTLINVSSLAQEVASINITRGGCYVDFPPGGGSYTYSFTMNITSGGTASTGVDASIIALVL